MKARRRGANNKIESKAARNMCFSKRRQGLFRKADEFRRLIPGVSVTAIAFSPAGTPFVSGDTSSLLPPLPTMTTDHTNKKNDEIIALLGLDITTLNAADLYSHRNDLLHLKNFLFSKRTEIQDNQVEDGSRGPSPMSIPTLEIQDNDVEDGSRVPSQMSIPTLEIQDDDIQVLGSMTRANCDDGPHRNEGSGFTLVESSTGIREDNNGEVFELMPRDLLHDGNANCDMDYGPSWSGFTQLQRSDGIQEEDDDELGMMLRNVCFSKCRQGLFRKADEFRRLIPGVSVTAIAFSPAGTPFVSGDTSSLLPQLPTTTTDHTNKKNDEIVALLGLNITTLNAADLESHRNDLLRLKNFLLSKRTEIQDNEVEDGYRGLSQMSIPTLEIQDNEVEDGSRGPSQMSILTLEIEDNEVDNGYQGPIQMSIPTLEIQEDDIQVLGSMTRANCDDGPRRNEGSEFTLVESSTGIQEDNNGEVFELMSRDLHDDGNANCDMDFGPSQFGFTQVQRSDGIQEDDDDELGMMLRDFLNDENCNMDFDDPW